MGRVFNVMYPEKGAQVIVGSMNMGYDMIWFVHGFSVGPVSLKALGPKFIE